MSPLNTFIICLSLAGAVSAAESTSSREAQLFGRWESFSLVSTNFDYFVGAKTATNLVLCVSQTVLHTFPTTGRQALSVQADLRIKNAQGEEIKVVDGPASIGENLIVIGKMERIGFPYQLTNDVLIIDCFSPKDVSGFKAQLRKVRPRKKSP